MSFALSLSFSADSSFSEYMKKISVFPVLTAQEENLLARKWSDDGDVEAAQTIVTSHLRMVVKVAMNFVNYGLPIMDMISEGNIGLMKAVKNFDYKLGFRVSTYATWWIKAAIQEYILRSWSIVKLGTSSAQRKLFFGLRKMKKLICNGDSSKVLSDADVSKVSCELAVSEKDVKAMDVIMSNSTYSLDYSGPEDKESFQDKISSDEFDHESEYIESNDMDKKKKFMMIAVNKLDSRHRDVFIKRKLLEKPVTLEKLRHEHGGISKERVRQIEMQAMSKVSAMCNEMMYDSVSS